MGTRQSILLSFSILLLFALLLFMVFGQKGFADYYAFKRQNESWVLKNEKLMQENLQLMNQIDRLENDPVYIEHIARKELGMIGKDEIIIRLSR
jgi:cell division protein FtsB